MVSEPAAAVRVLAVGREVSAMLFCSTCARVPGPGDGEPGHRHRPDIPTDAPLDSGFLAGPARVRAVAVEPGCEQCRRVPVAVDECGPDMPPEYRGPVVAAAGVAVGQVAAVLPEPAHKGGLPGGGQRMRADPHHRALPARTSPSSKKK